MTQEINRLNDLISYEILDTPPEKDLDELAEVASLICDVPISLITFIDTKRQWFKAKKGLEIDVTETRREDSFCQHTLNEPREVLVVEDLLKDARFQDNPLVNGEPYIRFYAGAPLETPNGNVLGTLCVVDTRPRKISTNQIKALRILAKKVMTYLNARKLLLQQRDQLNTNAERLKKLTDNVPGGIFQLRMSAEGKLNFQFISKGMQKLHPSIHIDQWLQSPEIGFSVIHPDDRKKFKEQLTESFTGLLPLYVEYRAKVNNEYRWHMAHGNPERIEDGSIVWYGSFQDINDRIEYETAMEQIAFDISHVLRRPVASLLGLNKLIENEKSITEAKLLEYVGYIKTVSLEMETFTRNLNEVYQRKKEMITGLHTP